MRNVNRTLNSQAVVASVQNHAEYCLTLETQAIRVLIIISMNLC